MKFINKLKFKFNNAYRFDNILEFEEYLMRSTDSWPESEMLTIKFIVHIFIIVVVALIPAVSSSAFFKLYHVHSLKT